MVERNAWLERVGRLIWAIDTGVLSALFGQDVELGMIASENLNKLRRSNTLLICEAVYAELLAHPNATTDAIGMFLLSTGVAVDFQLGEHVWREAGNRFSTYAARRRKLRGGQPRRILADFLIGAHALHRADQLLTFDASHYKTNFPDLVVIQPEPQ